MGFTNFTSSTSPVTGLLIGLGRSSRYPGTATQLSRSLISPSKIPYMGSKKVAVILAKSRIPLPRLRSITSEGLPADGHPPWRRL